MRRLWWLWLPLGLGLLIAGFALLSQRPGGVEKRLEAIRAQGLPTNLEELDLWLGTNAAAGRRNAAKLQALGDQIRVDTLKPVPGRTSANLSNDLVWAQTQLTEDNALLFSELHLILQQTQWRWANITMGTITNALDYLATVKSMASKLRIEVAAAALLGDTNRCLAAIRAGLRVGRTLEPFPALIDHLVAVACDNIAVENMETVLSRIQLPEPELKEVQSALEAAEGTNLLSSALIGERAFGSTIFQVQGELMAAALNPTAPTAPSGTEQTVGRLLYPFYRLFSQDSDFIHYLDQTERLILLTRMEGPDAKAAMDAFNSDLQPRRGDWRRILSRMSLASLARSPSKEWRRLAVMRAARVGCAVERFRVAHGTLPASLEELVPRFLDAIPADPMDGRPLKFRRLERGYVVYSVGEDGADNGGLEYARRPKGQSGGWDCTFTVER